MPVDLSAHVPAGVAALVVLGTGVTGYGYGYLTALAVHVWRRPRRARTASDAPARGHGWAAPPAGGYSAATPLAHGVDVVPLRAPTSRGGPSSGGAA